MKRKRFPHTPPELSKMRSLAEVAAAQARFNHALATTANGLPTDHADSHRPEHGVDALATAAPANPTGVAAAEGTADTLLRSDSVTKQGIVSTKGDLLGFSSVPARVPLTGTDNVDVLTKDSTQATGMKWAPPAAAGIDEANFFASYMGRM